MPNFEYIAKDVAGRQRSGVMQAESEAAVIRTLDERSLFPVRIGCQDDLARRGALFSRGRIRLRDLSATYGQLSDLLSAGVPMLRALDILSRTAVRPQLRHVLAAVREDVSGGETLAGAMGKHPETFGDLHVAMIRAGEHAGFLEDVLTNLATFLDRQDELRSKVTGAMIYPVKKPPPPLAAVLPMLIWLVPKFKDFLADMPLPLPSKILFGLSEMLLGHWPVMLVGLVLAAAGIWGGLRSEAGRRLWSQWKLRIPVAGRAIRMVAITRFCRVFGTMLANGINILQALAISKDATGNALMADAIEEAAENVRAGEPLAEPLSRSRFFPDEVIEMIIIAEEMAVPQEDGSSSPTAFASMRWPSTG